MKLIAFLVSSCLFGSAFATKTETPVLNGFADPIKTPSQTNDLSNNERSDPGSHRKDLQDPVSYQKQDPTIHSKEKQDPGSHPKDSQTQDWNRNKNNLSRCTNTQGQFLLKYCQINTTFNAVLFVEQNGTE